MFGWIALHRKIRLHWVWHSNFYPKRWVDLLFRAAWTDREINLGNRSVALKRGQLLTTTRQLMADWQTNTTTVVEFLRSLERSLMITRERNGKFTMITICNYDKYQSLSAGWIAIHRSILTHWVWQNNFTAKRWLDLLFRAAWTETVVDLGRRKVTLERGQLITSTRQLMSDWRADSQKVKEFLRALEQSEMIIRKRTGNLTIITICNFDKYQGPAPETVPELDASNASSEGQNPTQESTRLPPQTASSITLGNDDMGVTNAVVIEQYNNEKQKDSLSPREREENFFNELLNSEISIEDLMRIHKISKSQVVEWIEEFKDETFFNQHWHNDFNDARSHFFSWLRIQINKKLEYGTKQSKKRGGAAQTQDRREARRGTDAGGKKASDYGGSF